MKSNLSNIFRFCYNKKSAGIFLLLFVILCPLADAQLYLDDEVTFYVGETKQFPVRQPTRVAIGKPEVADVVNISDVDLTLAAKSAGATTLIYWDSYGEHSYKIKVLTEDMTETKKRIDVLLKELKLPGVHTKQNDQEGKVLLLGEVKNEDEKAKVDLALGGLKDKIIDLIEIKDEGIVEIEVRVLELDKDASKTLGFTMPGAFTATELSGPVSSAVTGYSALFHISDWTRTAFTHTLDLLIQEGKARVLSQPKLACLSGKEAELLVGGEKPLFTTAVQSTAGSTTTVEYKEYGIKLNIRPTITGDDRVRVALNIEVSEVGSAETIGDPNAPSAKAYPLTKRNVSTELFLNDGQTLSIGGLIKNKKEEDIRKVAGLGDIPILGALFRKKTTRTGGGQGERGDIELFITLTPNIVSKAAASIGSSQAYAKKSMQDISIEADVPEELKDYIKNVQSRIVSAAYYPPDAKEMGWEGIVKLNIILEYDGNLRDVKIMQSSGYVALDDAALDIVKKQAPYPAFPYEAGLRELQIEIPIAYRRDN